MRQYYFMQLGMPYAVGGHRSIQIDRWLRQTKKWYWFFCTAIEFVGAASRSLTLCVFVWVCVSAAHCHVRFDFPWIYLM